MPAETDELDRLVEVVTALIRPSEVFLLDYAGEDSDFVRFNAGRVRQAGHVRQRECQIALIRGQRSAEGTSTLSGEPGLDRARIEALLESLRPQLEVIEDDPYLIYATEASSGVDSRAFDLPDPSAAIAEIVQVAEGLDLVGLWASGILYRGYASSLGHRHWYRTGSFNFDFSLHLPSGQALKCGCAGQSWDPAPVLCQIAQAREQLALLGREPKRVQPGRYRVYLAPRAMTAVVGLLGWGGFGLKSHRTRQTPLLKMIQEGRRLHPSVTLVEDHAGGYTPRFTSAGFIKPDRVPLIEGGLYRECLADRRSAAEYGVPVNAEMELPRSLVMSPGDLPLDSVLERLGSGLYINTLWYCNFSDRSNCRLTGSTRFACFWVEEGRLVAPIDVMRFDESLYHILGEGLMGLTRERERILDSGTYECRSTASMELPGALVEGFTLTL